MKISELKNILEELEEQNLGNFEIRLSEPIFDEHGPLKDRHDFALDADPLEDICYSEKEISLGISRKD